MFTGLWTVEFSSTFNRSGTGVLMVLEGGRLLGGDAGYYYSGNYNYDHSNNKISGNLIIIRYSPLAIAVFGNLDTFKLSFSGELIDNRRFSLLANLPNQPQIKIRVLGTKKEDL